MAQPVGERGVLIASVRRFQLDESGDGQQLMRNVAHSGDFEYLQAIKLFVGVEQQHAALLLRLLGYLGGTPMRTHWSDAIFVRLRRLMGLRTELMDENPHVRFQRHRLHAGFADIPAPLRLLAFGLWWVTAIGATAVVRESTSWK